MAYQKIQETTTRLQWEFQSAMHDLQDYKEELRAARDFQATATELWVITLEITRIKNKLRSLAPRLAIDPTTIE